jgi:putative transcriptional regulator
MQYFLLPYIAVCDMITDRGEVIGISNMERIRKERGLTQVELAEKLGVRQSTISHIEQHRRNPSVPLLIKAAGILNTTVDELLGGDDGQIPDD